MYVGRGPPENCRGSGAPVQRTGGTGGSYGPALCLHLALEILGRVQVPSRSTVHPYSGYTSKLLLLYFIVTRIESSKNTRDVFEK